MITQQQCEQKYGPVAIGQNNSLFENKWMTLWDVPAELEVGVIPKKLYCNKDMVEPLRKAFVNLISRGAVFELKTWDGCFNIRLVRGSSTSMSLHSWGIAIDVNAAWNGLGVTPVLTPGFVKCFTDAGFDWGGTWQRKDGMHFQLATLPNITVVNANTSQPEGMMPRADAVILARRAWTASRSTLVDVDFEQWIKMQRL
jgi:hypothetical protein